ncbi:uncharacterized protein L969DRAFT_90019 [Mixia osmundae IAM 14324]|uniref:Small ribosomal subunit protein bS18m n=1 Tax=Mixia osmundae (strain CBS 9802 / IAM 14324 / JCM 22182 / KY 12970) TaxID=764103 RepID=G7DUP9_MIXOS|nr:uncharacterized protein L969DRAFT_90019 [Mixia osmundae IAM 14324]KEI37476.1 hypothetical protein L969DRAFT_90019 [Mixia osmundae IAM 14324]GAA94309.1 hypothetical protein E5Q_00958 [Mixia osmundae IAM 14324]
MSLRLGQQVPRLVRPLPTCTCSRRSLTGQDLSKRLAGLASDGKTIPTENKIKPYQVFASKDLGPKKMFKDNKPVRRKRHEMGPKKADVHLSDPFMHLGINPLKEPTNPLLHSHYLTQVGKIQTRAATGLSWKSQRRMGKAVRRARAMGLISHFAGSMINQSGLSNAFFGRTRNFLL